MPTRAELQARMRALEEKRDQLQQRARRPVRSAWQRVRRAWITLGLGATVVFVLWSVIAYRASNDAHAATRPGATVSVHHDRGVWSFQPRRAAAGAPTVLVFFPGALVDPIAYAPLVRAAADAGFPAYIVELPRRGAFGGADEPMVVARLQRVLRSTEATRWVIGGHSRGAVVASRIASQGRAGFSGLVLIGSTHPRDVSLGALRVPVTKIVGTRDGLARVEAVEANRGLLPAHTKWTWIEGANHSQFGWYGFQPGDRRATVDAATQRRVMIDAVLELLRQVGASPGA